MSERHFGHLLAASVWFEITFLRLRCRPWGYADQTTAYETQTVCSRHEKEGSSSSSSSISSSSSLHNHHSTVTTRSCHNKYNAVAAAADGGGGAFGVRVRCNNIILTTHLGLGNKTDRTTAYAVSEYTNTISSSRRRPSLCRWWSINSTGSIPPWICGTDDRRHSGGCHS